MSENVAVRDYSKCWYCQNSDNDKNCPLRQPWKSPSGKLPEKLRLMYKSAAEQAKRLIELGKQSETFVLDNVIPNVTVEQLTNTMLEKKAVWHRNCRLSHDKQKVERAETEDLKRQASDDPNPSPVKTRRSFLEDTIEDQADDESDDKEPPCLICNKQGQARYGMCHQAATLGLHAKVLAAAQTTRDTLLLAKLSVGDMVAIDAVYHLRCLAGLYRRADAVKKKALHEDTEKLGGAMQAFMEIQAYIESLRGVNKFFSMSEITNLYMERLQELGVDRSKHTTRLREALVEAIPDLMAVQNKKSGKWELGFDESISEAIMEMKKHETAGEKIMKLYEASEIVREAIFKKRSEEREILGYASLNQSTEELDILLSFIINGFRVGKAHTQVNSTKKVIKSSNHLISFHAVERRSEHSNVLRHSRDSEEPFPMYMGIKTYLKSGKELLDEYFSHGLSTSYDRVKQLATDIANTLIAKWKANGVVLPSNAVKGVLTCCGFDNIDWNARNPLAQLLSTLHGTMFVVHQFVDREQPYTMIEVCAQQKGKKTVQELPEFYTKIDYSKYVLDLSEPYRIPLQNKSNTKLSNIGLNDSSLLDESLLESQKRWLKDTKFLIRKDELELNDFVSWSAYFGSKSEALSTPNMTSSALPIFLEKASEPAMIAKIMLLSKAVTEALNPGQTPWLETDEPLYRKAKRIQQKYVEELGEKELLLTMGPLHKEKMLWNASGELTHGSGYTSVLAASGICTSGTADAIESVSNILRTRYVKTVTVAAIELLKEDAYLTDLETHETNAVLDDEDVEGKCYNIYYEFIEDKFNSLVMNSIA